MVKFWCEIRIMCIGKNILPNHGMALGSPSHDLEPFTGWARLVDWEDLPFRLASWALNDLSSFCRI